MPWNGSGVYTPPAASFPEVNGTVIDAGRYNPTLNDVAAGITNCLAKDGQNAPTANLPMGGYKLTNLAAGTVANDALAFGQNNATVGNLRVGATVTPTWSITPTIDIGASGSVYTNAASTNLIENSYFDGANKAKETGASMSISVARTGIFGYYAPSVAANAAQTYTEIFDIEPTGTAKFGGSTVRKLSGIVGAGTITTDMPYGVGSLCGGGLLIVSGADIGGQSFCAVYAVALRMPGGASPTGAAVLLNRAGSASPTLTVNANNSGDGMLTITVVAATGANQTYAYGLGF